LSLSLPSALIIKEERFISDLGTMSLLRISDIDKRTLVLSETLVNDIELFTVIPSLKKLRMLFSTFA
jgi:hypothetical protein